MRLIITAFLVSLLPLGGVSAQGVTTYPFDGTFDDALFNLENAIIDRGLKVDWTSHVGEMLARTGADIGQTTKVFDNAEIFLFCSASLSRKMMEADPLNIGYCPYGIFIMDPPGDKDPILIGYRNQPAGLMQEVQRLLDGIAREAAEK